MSSAGNSYIGYVGGVWQSVYNGLTYYGQQLTSFLTPSGSGQAPTSSLLSEMSVSMFTSLRHGVEAINAYNLAVAWTSELSTLQEIQTMPLVLSPSTIVFFNARVAAYVAGLAALTPLIPQSPYGAATVIASGGVIIPSPGLFNYFMTFNYETAPSGLTSANLLANATACAQAMLNVANAISVYQGNNLDQRYDVAYRQYQAALYVAN